MYYSFSRTGPILQGSKANESVDASSLKDWTTRHYR